MDSVQVDASEFIVRSKYEDGSPKVEIAGCEIHPHATYFEIMEQDRLNELAKSIRENGLREPIKIDSAERVVDGQNRLIACAAVGVTAIFEQIDDRDIDELIYDRNLNRRDMTTAQRLSAIEKLRPGISKAEAARAAGVSVRTTFQNEKINREGVEELKDAVQSGELSVKDGADIATLPAEKQQEILKDFKPEGTGGTPDPETKKKAKKKMSAAAKDVREQRAAQRVWTKESWLTSANNSYTSLLGKVPGDLKDWGKKELARVFHATVSIDNISDTTGEDLSAFMDAERIAQTAADMIANLPKSERKEAAELMAEKFGGKVEAPKPIKKADEAFAAIEAIRAGLSQAEQKKLAKLCPAGDVVPSDYPADPAGACDVFRKRVQSECKKLQGVQFASKEESALVVVSVESVEKTFGELIQKCGGEPDDKDVEIPQQLQDPRFESLWKEWQQIRRKNKKRVTNAIQNRQYRILANFDLRQAIEIVGKAIEGEWQGIPVMDMLTRTMWDGRAPAHAAKTGARMAKDIVPRASGFVKEREKDRSEYGQHDPTDNRTMDERLKDDWGVDPEQQ